jgi:hypothetical protein
VSLVFVPTAPDTEPMRPISNLLVQHFARWPLVARSGARKTHNINRQLSCHGMVHKTNPHPN